MHISNFNQLHIQTLPVTWVTMGSKSTNCESNAIVIEAHLLCVNDIKKLSLTRNMFCGT